MIRLTLTALLVFALNLGAQLQPCTFVKITPTCGPEFKATDKIGGQPKAHQFKLEVKKAPKNGFGFLAIGVKKASYKFPGTNCLVFVSEPLSLYAIQTDSSGKWKLEVEVSQALRLDAMLQTAFDNRGAVQTSNGLKVKCKS